MLKIGELLGRLFRIGRVDYINGPETLKPPLSNEEELYYLELFENGDITARDKLIEHNLRLVAHIIKKYESKFISNDDLISIGTIGLIKGVDTYSLDKGVKITTYCAKCIENATIT